MDSGCLIKDSEVGYECKVGSNAVIVGKSSRRRDLKPGGRTVQILPGSQIPHGMSLISEDKLTVYGDNGLVVVM